MPGRLPLAHSFRARQTNLAMHAHSDDPPALPEKCRKDKGGRLLRRPQRDHPAATVAEFPTAVLTDRPVGAGRRARIALVDLARIPDPEAWLANRLGPLASCEIRRVASAEAGAQGASDAARSDALGSRLTAGMQAVLAARRTALDELARRLVAAEPVDLRANHTPNPREEE